MLKTAAWGQPRGIHRFPRQRRGKGRDESVDVISQLGVAAHGQPGHVVGEQMARVDGGQVAVTLLVLSNRRDDAHAQAQLDTGLDHVGIHCHQHHVEVQGRRETQRRCVNGRCSRSRK